MPTSIKRDPFCTINPTVRPAKTGLRTPQARVLAALMPARIDDPPIEWPLLTRAQLGVRAGYTSLSGTITRALNGIRPGSSSGDAHLGLIARGLVEEQSVDVDGVTELNYRITAAGICEYSAYTLITGSQLPALKDPSSCTNDRYRSYHTS